MVLEIDVQGARQVREALPDARLVFIEPPSFDALAERLAARGSDSPDQIERAWPRRARRSRRRGSSTTGWSTTISSAPSGSSPSLAASMWAQ